MTVTDAATLARALQLAERGYRRDHDRATRARDERDRLIRLALAEGWTHAQVAAATGLTRGRIGQLAQEHQR